MPQLVVNVVLGRLVLPMKYVSDSPFGVDPMCIYEFSSWFTLGSFYMTYVVQPPAITSADDLLGRLSQAASISKAHYTVFTDRHAALPSIKILKASVSAVNTAANTQTLCSMSSVLQMTDIVYTASAAAARIPAVLLASEVSRSIMPMMPADGVLQATMVTEAADSIFLWAVVTTITLISAQHADLASHHHTLPAVYAAVSPALVLPTITPGLDTHSVIIHRLDMHSVIIHGLDMHSVIIRGLDMHSMIIHGGEHDHKLSGHQCDQPLGLLHQLESKGGPVQGTVQGSPYKIALARMGLLAAAAILFTGMTFYWTYTARWPHSDKPGGSMASTFSYVPPAHTGMSAVQWHITFRQRRTTATSRLTTAVAPAASAGPEMVSAAKSRQAQAGPRVPPVKGPAMVNTFNLSCSSDTDVAVGLAIADKQRAGLVGDQTAPRMLFTDRREEVSTGVDAAVPVAGGDSLEVPAAQMQESSQQIIQGAAASSHGKWKGTLKTSVKSKLKGGLKSLKTGVKRRLCSGCIQSPVVD
ncbi:hypothetical protein WJX79_003802 [Trebouxia sp. C0005]